MEQQCTCLLCVLAPGFHGAHRWLLSLRVWMLFTAAVCIPPACPRQPAPPRAPAPRPHPTHPTPPHPTPPHPTPPHPPTHPSTPGMFKPKLVAYHRYTGSWLNMDNAAHFLTHGGLDGRLFGTAEVQDAVAETIDDRWGGESGV